MVKNVKKNVDNSVLSPVYGARMMAKPIPEYELQEESLPGSLAYQVIHDELALDSKPAQNLASFVTTWMEREVDELVCESIKLNLADEYEYPHVIKIQERCVNIIARLMHAHVNEGENAVGTSTIGSSEAVMLAGLAMKKRWELSPHEKTGKPNLVMGHNVQVVWEKFARYFDVEPRYIPMDKDCYLITPEKVLEYIDENTIGVCAILGTTFTGEFEPIKEINDALIAKGTINGWEVPLHVDAASGGFVAPFLYPELEWDFRLDRVVSINISGHKYGLVYPGIGWVLWRDDRHLPEELKFYVDYLGGEKIPTFTLNFSRPATGVVAQYYNLLRLGKEGYRNIMSNLKANADYMTDEIAQFDCFELVSNKQSLPLVAWKVKDDTDFDGYDLSDKLKEFGWVVPAYPMPPDAHDIVVLRAVVREHLSRDMAYNFICNVKQAVKELKAGHKRTKIKKSTEKASLHC